jgi:hypothetical protein
MNTFRKISIFVLLIVLLPISGTQIASATTPDLTLSPTSTIKGKTFNPGVGISNPTSGWGSSNGSITLSADQLGDNTGAGSYVTSFIKNSSDSNVTVKATKQPTNGTSWTGLPDYNNESISAGDFFHVTVTSTSPSGTAHYRIQVSLADTTAPVLRDSSASSVSRTGATLNFKSDEGGSYYFLVYAAASTAPDAATVEAQGTAVAKGTSITWANWANALVVTGLTASTSYKAYVIVKDAAGNRSEVSTIEFTTLAPPDSTAPLLSFAFTSSITATGADLRFTSNEAGTYFYLVYSALASAHSTKLVYLDLVCGSLMPMA